MSKSNISRRARETGWDEHHPQLILSGCAGKDPLTWAQAKAISDRGFRQRRSFKVYHCSVCRAWHIGSAPKLKRSKRWRQL